MSDLIVKLDGGYSMHMAGVMASELTQFLKTFSELAKLLTNLFCAFSVLNMKNLWSQSTAQLAAGWCQFAGQMAVAGGAFILAALQTGNLVKMAKLGKEKTAFAKEMKRELDARAGGIQEAGAQQPPPVQGPAREQLLRERDDELAKFDSKMKHLDGVGQTLFGVSNVTRALGDGFAQLGSQGKQAEAGLHGGSQQVAKSSTDEESGARRDVWGTYGSIQSASSNAYAGLEAATRG